MRFQKMLETSKELFGRLLGGALKALYAAIEALDRFVLWSARSPRVRALRRPAIVGGRIVVVAALLAGIGLALGSALVRRVPPGMIAVRQVNWGPDAGIARRDEGPGLRWTFAGRTGWHLLDAGTHVVRFDWDTAGGTENILAVVTKGGESAQVAVAVPYRIRSGEGWRIVQAGLKNDYQKRATAITRRVLLEELAQLDTEDFANPAARGVASERALARLDGELAPTFLEPLDVLIGSVYFEKGYEKMMQQKLLATQTELTDRSIAARETQKLLTERELHDLAEEEKAIVESADFDIEQEKIRLEKQVLAVTRESKEYDARRRMDVDREYERRVADGELALARVEALRDRLRNEALETIGGRLHLAREAAQNLRFSGVTLDTSDPRVPNVLDLDRMVELLVGRMPEDGGE